jgi:hypothetical protein
MRYQQMADTAASRMVCSKIFMVFLDRMAPAHNCRPAATAAAERLGQQLGRDMQRLQCVAYAGVAGGGGMGPLTADTSVQLQMLLHTFC